MHGSGGLLVPELLNGEHLNIKTSFDGTGRPDGVEISLTDSRGFRASCVVTRAALTIHSGSVWAEILTLREINARAITFRII